MEKFSLRYFKAGSIIPIIIILGLLLFATNKYLSSHWGVSFSVFAVAAGVISIINSHLWKYRPFIWLYDVPNFSGRYEGTSKFEYRDNTGNIFTGEMEHIKVIKQNGSSISISSWAKTYDGSISTKSASINANIYLGSDGIHYLTHTYLNNGNSEKGFAPYFGTENLQLIENETGKYLIGNYYTERIPYQTKGKINLNFTSNKLYHEI